jgi:TPR repeat protein
MANACSMAGAPRAMKPPRWAGFHKAAQAGLAEGMNMVGRCLDQGWGTPQSPRPPRPGFALRQSAGWIGAIQSGHPAGAGPRRGGGQGAGAHLFRQAAAQGHAKSMTMVGSFYEDGWAVPANLAVAAYHYAAGPRRRFSRLFQPCPHGTGRRAAG